MEIVTKIIEKFIEHKRPPIEIRKELDIGFTFEKNVLEIFEIRPSWQDKSKIINTPVAKSKYIKSKEIWKIYWKRASGKWELYKPNGEVNSIREVVKIIEEDTHGCFWG